MNIREPDREYWKWQKITNFPVGMLELEGVD